MTLFLPTDLILIIFDYLENNDKFSFFKSFNKSMYEDLCDSGYKIEVNKLINIEIYPFRPKDTIYCATQFLISYDVNYKFLSFYKGIKIKTLVFGDYFNKKIDNLFLDSSNSITSLIFGDKFNQPVDILSLATPNLTSLTFGQYFKQSLDCLPKSITSLIFSGGISYNIDISKLPNLTYLEYWSLYDYYIKPTEKLKVINTFKK